MDDTGNPSDFVKVTLSPDHPRTAGKAIAPKTETGTSQEQGTGQRKGLYQPPS